MHRVATLDARPGLSRAELLDEMPDLENGDIDAALKFASGRLDHPILAA
ncbi:MAG: DUF433 domain-containing protein [Flavobacteriales bacterium]|nr:DUF433 domain-containing protein [Flavobacteriales bacterium]